MTATAVASTPMMDVLEERFRRAALLSEAQSVLHWDASVTMPRGAAPSRGEQLAELDVLAHGIIADSSLIDLFGAAEAEPLDGWRRANLREMRRQHVHASALPEALVGAMTRAGSACESVWRDARAKSDFAAVLPLFEQVVALAREAAAAKAGVLGLSPYDALLDRFEPDARIAEIEPVFAALERFLVDFLPRAEEAQARAGAPLPLNGPYDLDAQRSLIRDMAGVVGFDFQHGRLDESAHPFSTSWPGDRRITVRYDEADPLSALFAVLHECGHSLYEAALPKKGLRQPIGAARGMQLHESQSLAVEMQVGRSDTFLSFLAPRLQQAFDGAPEFAADNLAKLVRRVERGFIRVEADEVTYPLHVILRTRLERALLSGDLAPRDLPGAWNEGFAALMGRTPPEDRLGCLQDIHWYDGAFGYFPTYTLGAMSAAQLFQAAQDQDSSIAPAIAAGDLKPLLAWLGTHVHGLGSSQSTRDILIGATGRPLEAAAFEQHLQRRYGGL